MIPIRYYRKLLASFLSIALIYTLLLNVTFISWYQLSHQETVQRTTDATARRIGEYVDFQLQSVKEISHLLRISEYTRKYLMEDPAAPDRYSRLKLSRFISSIYGVAPSQKNGIAVTKISDDYAITQSSSGNLDAVLEEFHLSHAVLDDVVAEFREEFNLPLKIVASSDADGQRYYTVICREWLGQENPLYILVSYQESQLLPVEEIGSASFYILYHGQPVASTGSLEAEEAAALISQSSSRGGGGYTRSRLLDLRPAVPVQCTGAQPAESILFVSLAGWYHLDAAELFGHVFSC